MYKGSLEGGKPVDGLGDAILLPHLFSLGCDGSLYASSPSSAVVMCLPTGSEKFEVYAGVRGKKGSEDGPRLESTFCGPHGLEAWDDVGGRLWVADASAHTLRLVLGNEIRTVAGRPGVKGSVDGKARFLGSDFKGGVATTITTTITTPRQTSPASTPRFSLVSAGKSSANESDESENFALLDSPQFVMRLRTQHTLIIAEMVSGRLRMLNLDTWQVTTLRLSGEIVPPFNLWSVPFLATPSSEAEFIKVHTYSTGVLPLKIDLKTGTAQRMNGEIDETITSESEFDSISSSSSSSSLTSELGPSWESSSSLADLMASSAPSSPRQSKFNLLPITSSDDFPMNAAYTFGSFFTQLDTATGSVYAKDFYMSQPFAFVPHSNSLLYCSGSGQYSLKPNFLTPHPPYPQSTAISPTSPRRAPILRRLNLAPLMDSPDLYTDFTLFQKSTGTSWNLHSQVLLFHPGLKLEWLKKVILESSAPAASIEAFLRYLYFDDTANTDDKHSCMLLAYSMLLASQIGLDDSRLAIDFSACATALSEQDWCDVLIEVWESDNWQESDYVVQYLVAGVNLDLIKRRMPISGLAFDKLASLGVLLDEPCDIPSISQFGLAEAPGLPSIPIFSVRTPPNPASLLVYSSDFIFVSQETNGESYSVRASSIHMFAQWKWFRRLLKINHRAAETRVIRLNLSVFVIKAILEPLHGGRRTPLLEEECEILLQNAKLFGLISPDNLPIAPFAPLINQCRDACFPKITEDNQFKLLQRCKRLRNFDKAAQIIDQIFASNSLFTFRNLSEILDTDLLLLSQARARGYGLSWVKANIKKF